MVILGFLYNINLVIGGFFMSKGVFFNSNVFVMNFFYFPMVI